MTELNASFSYLKRSYMDPSHVTAIQFPPARSGDIQVVSIGELATICAGGNIVVATGVKAVVTLR
ncbi:hypothetical protein [Haloquadratum walsbyi]|uniref:DUF7839 domain-containing protein n=1 Tax=Haloquadratum walsbyi J07HQW2 TaxID=1238425 RepID=U1N161_9EURY|nr:hypothetical protein [Haloquadratum walsbyi]ERG96574.1 MAG: hypothetical protein J07HQW2_03054 [Haloquadratum walsbyi J07HQW2]